MLFAKARTALVSILHYVYKHECPASIRKPVYIHNILLYQRFCHSQCSRIIPNVFISSQHWQARGNGRKSLCVFRQTFLGRFSYSYQPVTSCIFLGDLLYFDTICSDAAPQSNHILLYGYWLYVCCMYCNDAGLSFYHFKAI